MRTRSLALLAAALVAVTTSAAVQKRVSPKGPADFPSTIRAAGAAWESGEYGQCVKELKTALGLANGKRSESIRAAFPAAPEGWKVEPERNVDATNPFAAAMASSVGTIVERKYKQEGGRGAISCTLTADSPLVQMFTMWMANPALLGEGAELIEYEAHRAVLKSEGQGYNLQILINGAHVCEVRAQGVSEDALFKMFDQRVVDGLAKVLGD